jgi:hypothetical protein
LQAAVAFECLNQEAPARIAGHQRRSTRSALERSFARSEIQLREGLRGAVTSGALTLKRGQDDVAEDLLRRLRECCRRDCKDADD